MIIVTEIIIYWQLWKWSWFCPGLGVEKRWFDHKYDFNRDRMVDIVIILKFVMVVVSLQYGNVNDGYRCFDKGEPGKNHK